MASLQDAYIDGEGDLLVLSDTGTEPAAPLVISVPGGGAECEIFRLNANGDVLLRGRLIGNDPEILALLTNAAGANRIDAMGAFKKLCEPCRSMLRCEDAATRLGNAKPKTCPWCYGYSDLSGCERCDGTGVKP